MFSNPRNVNSSKENFTNYSRLVIRTTNLYCENVISLNLTHALPGGRPMAFVTFSASTKLPFEIFLFFCIFIYTKIVWINFSRLTCVCELFLYIILLRDFDTYMSDCMLLYPEYCFLNKHHFENSEPLICIFFVQETVH